MRYAVVAIATATATAAVITVPDGGMASQNDEARLLFVYLLVVYLLVQVACAFFSKRRELHVVWHRLQAVDALAASVYIVCGERMHAAAVLPHSRVLARVLDPGHVGDHRSFEHGATCSPCQGTTRSGCGEIG